MDGDLVALPPGGVGLWEAVFTVAPLVVVGTVEEDGRHDLAPKHMVTPLGWSSYYGFVCTPRHRTYGNVVRTGEFTVSFPVPEQIVAVGQAAAHRHGGEKGSLAAIPTVPAETVEGVHLDGCRLRLECELDRIVEGFDQHDLIVGRIVAAAAPTWALRDPDADDAELVNSHPQLAFLSPCRFGAVAESYSFPFPAEFTR